MPYPLKTFDQFFEEILTDWRNQSPEADVSPGSLIFIKSACLASVKWGIQHNLKWNADQIFPDTADVDKMEHHAYVRGLSRKKNETNDAYLQRLLDYIRRPPAGGNKYDYVKWANSFDEVKAAYCFPLAQGLGTVDVVIIANETITGDEMPSFYADKTGTITGLTVNKLIDGAGDFFDPDEPVQIGDLVINDALATEAKVTAIDEAGQLTLDTDIFTLIGETYTIKALTTQVKDYIQDVRPTTASVFRVLPPTITEKDVTMTVTAAGLDKLKIASEISAYIKTLIPGGTLYINRFVTIAINEGATDAAVTIPADNVVPGTYEMLRPGTISVL